MVRVNRFQKAHKRRQRSQSQNRIPELNPLEKYLDELRLEQPEKCHCCECLQINWNGTDWVAECSEDECYMDNEKQNRVPRQHNKTPFLQKGSFPADATTSCCVAELP